MNKISELINLHHESIQEPPRPHMGVSQLGQSCGRRLWLQFHWAIIEKFPGRILRLFRRGHLEEKTIINDLTSIGVDFIKTNGEQARVDFGAHVSGSVDGLIAGGVPGDEKTPHLFEAKTHSLKSFRDLVKNGVEKSKFIHFIQMQVYMLGSGMPKALYYAVCKDNDEIYTEIVEYNDDIAGKYVERGQRIALNPRLPEPISASPDWWECKFCPAYGFCHKTIEPPPIINQNCRTCQWATAEEDSTWTCERIQGDGGKNIPLEFQRTGCEHYKQHPDLLPF